jgi:conjugal transfer/entry exclusion protein
MTEMIHASCLMVPEAEIYRFGCSELSEYIIAAKESIEKIEIQLGKRSPTLFRQFPEFDHQKKEEAQFYMKILKNTARLNARRKWYEWREKLVDTLYSSSIEYESQLLKVNLYLYQIQHVRII